MTTTTTKKKQKKKKKKKKKKAFTTILPHCHMLRTKQNKPYFNDNLNLSSVPLLAE